MGFESGRLVWGSAPCPRGGGEGRQAQVCAQPKAKPTSKSRSPAKSSGPSGVPCSMLPCQLSYGLAACPLIGYGNPHLTVEHSASSFANEDGWKTDAGIPWAHCSPFAPSWLMVHNWLGSFHQCSSSLASLPLATKCDRRITLPPTQPPPCPPAHPPTHPITRLFCPSAQSTFPPSQLV